jgi:hypothetical protein
MASYLCGLGRYHLGVKANVAALVFLIGSAGLSVKADAPVNPEIDRIYQFFVPSDVSKDRPNLGAYLWIPPNTP